MGALLKGGGQRNLPNGGGQPQRGLRCVCLGVGNGELFIELWRGKHSMWDPWKELLLTSWAFS